MSDLFLVYVKPFTSNADGTFEYDLFFSETPDVVWGYDWEINNPGSCEDLTPDKSTYSVVKRIKSPLPFKTIEETSCYSMEYAIGNIIALSWVDLSNLEEYPENGRCVLHFGDSLEKTEETLKNSECVF